MDRPVSCSGPQHKSRSPIMEPFFRFMGAPAQEATHRRSCDGDSRGVSIHAPVQGATTPALLHKPAGRVSIHAPALGATLWQTGTGNRYLFQSTLPRGERPYCHSLMSEVLPLFQSTPPCRGATPPTAQKMPTSSCFNPHSGAGSDGRCPAGLPDAALVSTHAPAQGGDFPPDTLSVPGPRFNPRPRARGNVIQHGP